VRIVIAEDSVLLRDGLAGLLEDDGHEVVARVGDAEALIAAVGEHAPDLAIADVRMPPGYSDEGMRAATEIRSRWPGIAVLMLSQHVETRHALELIRSGGGFGYLLKDRVLDTDDFLETARRVASGGSALDPEVVATLIPAPVAADPLADLTPREHEVLGLIVGGASNKEGAHQLGITTRTFEVHRAHIMEKLGARNAADLVRMALSESR
jgi:DNA-binding NarL/FixJ family response regulator